MIKNEKKTTAFSLIELMLSVVMVSIITVALSMALFRSKEKTDEYSASLTSTQDVHAILRQIARDCRHATKIRRVMDTKYLITITENPLKMITYSHKVDNTLTMMFNGIPDCKMLLSHVTEFSFEAQITTRNNIDYLSNLTLVISIGSENESETYTHALSLLNQPRWVGNTTQNEGIPYY
jgi:type II secretory pathway pseudopilin PulG